MAGRQLEHVVFNKKPMACEAQLAAHYDINIFNDDL